MLDAPRRKARSRVGTAGALNPSRNETSNRPHNLETTMRNIFFSITLAISGLLPIAVIASAFVA
jgi:hypothetical protein